MHQNTKLTDTNLWDLAATTALGFNQENKKTGESGRRYGAYKAAKTVAEYKQLSPAKLYTAKDFTFDLERGHVWLLGVRSPAAYTLAGMRVAKRVHAAGRFARVDDENFAAAPLTVSVALACERGSVDLNALFGGSTSAAELCPEPSFLQPSHASGIDLENLEGATVTMSAEIALAERNLARFLNTAWSESEARSLPHLGSSYGLIGHVDAFVVSAEPAAPPVLIRSVRQARADTARWDGPGRWKAAFEADLERASQNS
jgi:hypothetical protein